MRYINPFGLATPIPSLHARLGNARSSSQVCPCQWLRSAAPGASESASAAPFEPWSGPINDVLILYGLIGVMAFVLWLTIVR